MKILLATGNEGKRNEMVEAFRVHGLGEDIEFASLKDLGRTEDPEETGTTFEENALLKAKFFADITGLPSIGEDSGLILDACPEKFGLRTRREIPEDEDKAWLDAFLTLLEGETNRKATFYSSMAYYDPQTQKEFICIGECSGVITEQPETEMEPGIPVSAVFIPDGHDVVYSAMTKEAKNAVSHRGWSAHAMADFLRML
jgi:XTP/dITP diphosphohydrolase